MDNSCYYPNNQLLRRLMAQVQISSLDELSRLSGISPWQLSRLEQGLLPKMDIETIVKLAQTLDISLGRLLALFLPESLLPHLQLEKETSVELASLRAEYQRLEQRLGEQRETLQQEFTRSSLDVLESWLIYWPTAVAAVETDANFAAKKLLPLVKPLEKLLAQWGVETLGRVGEEIAYDPQYHQLLAGDAQPGDRVKVRNVGYRQQGKLLHRVKVSRI